MFTGLKQRLDKLTRDFSTLSGNVSKALEQASHSKQITARVRSLEGEMERLRLAMGRVELRQVQSVTVNELEDAEFSVFSQWGEDGIIQFLLRHVPVMHRTFIEFGIQDYTESNTRFLLQNNNWSGLVIDGSEQQIQRVKSSDLYWRHNLKAVTSFVTRENINELFRTSGFSGDVGLLSVDIDGNDYWVWEAIDAVAPRIVIIEYNSRFGPDAAVTVPYADDFVRQKAHSSCIYYGASLRALSALGERKGYGLVGSNSAGNNAFFVRKDLITPPLKIVSAAAAFRQAQFREARDENGALTFLSAAEEQAVLEKLPLVKVPV